MYSRLINLVIFSHIVKALKSLILKACIAVCYITGRVWFHALKKIVVSRGHNQIVWCIPGLTLIKPLLKKVALTGATALIF